MIFCYYNVLRSLCRCNKYGSKSTASYLNKLEMHFKDNVIAQIEKNLYRGGGGDKCKSMLVLFEDLYSCSKTEGYTEYLTKYMKILDKVKPHADIYLLMPKNIYGSSKYKAPSDIVSNIYIKDRVTLTTKQLAEYGAHLFLDNNTDVVFKYEVPDSSMKVSNGVSNKKPFYIGAYGKAQHLRFGNQYFVLSPGDIFDYEFNGSHVHENHWYGIDLEYIGEIIYSAREMKLLDTTCGMRNF